MPKIGVYIPCYNVQHSIKDLLNGFATETLKEIDKVLVVDNCSQDNTFKILEEIKQSTAPIARHLVLIRNPTNVGLGGSQKIAYQYFIDHHFSHFMIIHGDNQADGQEVAASFLNYFKANPDVDLVIASRFLKNSDTSHYDFSRVAGNLVFNWLTFILTGHRMSDSGAAIIFIKTDILKEIPFHQLTNSFQFNPQLNILLYELKALKMGEVNLRWKDSRDRSNITAFNYCWTLLGILTRYSFNKNLLGKKGWQAFL